MSKLSTQDEYEKLKAQLKAMAAEKEASISTDLAAVRKEYMPKYIKRKILTSCALFGTTYLVEHLIFKKKVPGIVKLTGAIAASVMAPRLYNYVQNNFLIVGDVDEAGEIKGLLPESDVLIEPEVLPVPEQTIPESSEDTEGKDIL